MYALTILHEIGASHEQIQIIRLQRERPWHHLLQLERRNGLHA